MNQESILLEDEWWNEVLPEKTQEEKEEQYWQEIADCGKPIKVWDATTGRLRIIKHRRCKHYRDCPQCRNWRMEQERRLLGHSVDRDRYTEISEEEAKKLVRKYGSSNTRRIPLENGNVALVIKTDDDIGEMFSNDKLDKIVVNCIPFENDNRRISGKLGIDQEKEIEEQKDTIQIRQRQMCFDFDSEDENAPTNDTEMNKMVQEEVEIYENPDTGDKLQDAIYVCEQKVQSICKRYGMSFSFLVVRLNNVDIKEVNWKWTKFKHPLN